MSNDAELHPGPFFKFRHLNAGSLNRNDKFDEISDLVKENGFDVFAVTETWLNDRVSTYCLQIPGYNPIIRLDSHQRMGGGVAFFTVTIRPNDKPWMDGKVRLAIRRRDRLLRIHNIRPSPVTRESYRVQRNIVMYQSIPKPPIPPGNPRAFDSR